MERKKSAVTPENYTRAIISLSRRYSSTSVFPGNNYVDIAEWMRQDRALLSSPKLGDDAILFASRSSQPHDLVVVYNSGERKWSLQHFSQEQHEAFYTATAPVPANSSGSGQIIFLRGFVSPSWVSAIGSRYNIDPEFFRRHMDFLSTSIDRHLFSSPSLATSSHNIFRLCISTILHRDDFGGQDLQYQRSQQSAELATYKTQQLGSTRVCCGDSLVREYSIVCSSFTVIEQWISLCFTRTKEGWAVLAWMDQGRPLEKSPPGPWTAHIKSKATSLPILQYHPKMAFRTTTNRLDAEANATADIQQSAAILPLQYESLIALVDLARRAPHDPLSMCIPLFTHAASSEVQFLNLMDSRIQMQIKTIAEGAPSDVLGTLQYFFNILNRHAQQLKDTMHAICKLAERSSQISNAFKVESPGTKTPLSQEPRMTAQREPSDTETLRSLGSHSTSSAFTPKGIMEDFEQLHVRCTSLSSMCTWGINLAMNKASIDESRKGMEQSERVKRLTLLATLFIPLGFSASLLGMNVDLLGQNAVKFWWFFVLCIPITLFAYIFYLCDIKFLKQCWRRLAEEFRRASRKRSVTGKSETVWDHGNTV